MAISDVNVTIDLVKPAALIGLGTPLIMANKTGASTYKEYLDLDSVVVDFANTTNAYKKAAAIFGQTNRPNKIAIATYDSAATPTPGTPASILDQYFSNDWEFLILADAAQADKLAVSTAIETKGFKMLVVKVSDEADRAAFKTHERTIVFYHPVDAEDPDAALVGAVGSKTVGSVTWKFKALAGITPQSFSTSDITAIHADGAIAYVTKAGVSQTSEGITASGEYIDIIHGRDWVKANMETSLQALLMENDKIPSNDKGISLIAATMTTVLTTATRQGIIDLSSSGDPLYTITTIPWDQTSANDQSKRVYSGASFNYTAQGAIHAVNVHGSIAA